MRNRGLRWDLYGRVHFTITGPWHTIGKKRPSTGGGLGYNRDIEGSTAGGTQTMPREALWVKQEGTHSDHKKEKKKKKKGTKEVDHKVM